jgi:plastocyanin
MHAPRIPRRTAILAALSVVAIASVAAGCGGSSSSGSSSTAASTTTSATQSTAQTGTSTGTNATTVLNIMASASELAYVPNALSAPAGRVTIRMTNPSQLQHSIALAVSGVTPGQVVGNGGVSEVSATLAAGTYTFYCTVPGHRQAGMTGTLTVH